MEDLRNVGESSCNPGGGKDQRVQSLMFMKVCRNTSISWSNLQAQENGNFAYFFQQYQNCWLWYTMSQFASNRSLRWQCLCITWDFGFVALLFSCPSARILLPSGSGPPHTSVAVDTNQLWTQRNILEERLTNLNYVWGVTPCGLSENPPS